MKKSIVITLILALLISLTTAVSAVTLVPVTAHLSGVPELPLKGDEFTVSITLTNNESGETETATNGGYRINYDASVLEYVGSNSAYPQTGEGTVRLDYLGNTSDTFTVTFKVIGTKGSKSPITFEPIQFTQTDIELKAQTVSAEVVVGPAEEEPSENNPSEETNSTPNEGTTPTNPEEDEKPSEVEKEDDNSNASVDENDKPTKIPQTGINYIVVAGIIVSVAAVVVLVKKFND